MRAMRNRPRRFAAVAAACAALAAGTIGAVAANPAHADACDSIEYTVVSSWNGGHQAAVSLTAGTEAVNGWTIGFDLPGGAAVQNAWNVDWSQSGAAFTGSDVGWNGSVASGQTRELFGLIVSGSCGRAERVHARRGRLRHPEPTTSAEPTTSEEPTEDPTTDPPGDCPAGAVCDDFEDQAGTVPGGDWTVGASDCTGTGTAAVDTAVANSGDTSIRIEGGATYCNHVFIGRDLPADAEWFRVYMRHTTRAAAEPHHDDRHAGPPATRAPTCA